MLPASESIEKVDEANIVAAAVVAETGKGSLPEFSAVFRFPVSFRMLALSVVVVYGDTTLVDI